MLRLPSFLSLNPAAIDLCRNRYSHAVFQQHCRTDDEHAIVNLICDLEHLAEERGFDARARRRRRQQ